MVAQIFLIRHGETPWSLSGQHTSRTDVALTAEGERRASELRGVLAGVSFAHVFTSPLGRARRTCELAGCGAAAQIEPDLQEWNYGDYEGRTSAEIHAERPGWNIFLDGCPQGESVEQVSERADRLLARLRPLAGTVGLFSHGHFLRSLAVRWVGLPVREGEHLALDTASVSTLGYERSQSHVPALTLWNRVGHNP